MGEDEGRWYLAYEFTPGQNLRQHMAGRAMHPRQALEIGIQIADALAEAHSHDVLHADLRPENIVITGKGSSKLLDIGMAGWTRGGAARSQIAKSPMQGTDGAAIAAYMSPEQTIGGEVDSRTDLFSLGVIVYEMLTGRTPFAGTTAAETVINVTARVPTPPTGVAVELPKELDTTLGRALAKDLDSRQQSAVSFAAELRSIAAMLDVRAGDTVHSDLIPLDDDGEGTRPLVGCAGCRLACWESSPGCGSDNRAELIRVDIRTRQHHCHSLRQRLLRSYSSGVDRGDGSRGGPFDNQPLLDGNRTHCRSNAIFGCGRHLSDETPNDVERHRLRIEIAGQTIGKGRHDGDRDDVSGGETVSKRRRGFRLDPGHGHRSTRLSGDGDATDQSTAANRNDNQIDARKIFENLQSDGSCSCNHIRVGIRRDVHGPILPRIVLGLFLGSVVIAARPDVHSKRADRVKLYRRRAGRDVDPQGHAGSLCRVRERAAVITGGSSHE